MILLRDDEIDLSDYYATRAGSQVKSAENWREALIDRFHGVNQNDLYPSLPWNKTKEIFRFRPGEVSIVAGMNGHGKSLVWNQVLLCLIAQGAKVGLSSLEMKPAITLARAAQQAYALQEPSVDELHRFIDWTTGKFWLHDKVGNFAPNDMIALIRYAHKNFGITDFCIDNLTKTVAGEDDFNGQKNFVSQLTDVAGETGVRMHLVMHVRKTENEDKVPSKMDLRGSAAITDLVDNVFIVWRNKAKEVAKREGKTHKDTEPDAVLDLAKQRHGEGEDNEERFQLWFDWKSKQYLGDRHQRPQMMRALQHQFQE